MRLQKTVTRFPVTDRVLSHVILSLYHAGPGRQIASDAGKWPLEAAAATSPVPQIKNDSTIAAPLRRWSSRQSANGPPCGSNRRQGKSRNADTGFAPASGARSLAKSGLTGQLPVCRN